MKERIVSINYKDLSNPSITEIRELVIHQFLEIVDNALQGGHVDIEILAKAGVKYIETEYDFPLDPLFVFHKGKEYVRCSLELWYGTNVSIPKFYEKQFNQEFIGDYPSKEAYEQALRLYGCRKYIQDINKLCTGKLDYLDYQIFQVRKVDEVKYPRMVYDCDSCRLVRSCKHIH